MKDLKQHLIDGDPVAREPGLDPFHAQTMRQRVLVEACNQPAAAPAFWWLRPVAVACALAACLVVAVVVGLRISESPYVERPFQGRGQSQGRGRGPSVPPRQLQFATPGGTRIIWTLHQDLDL